MKGSVRFVDGATLHFKGFLRLNPTVIRLKYAYHYVTSDGRLIFRYDDARDPAARNLSSYPHHKHSPEGLLVFSKPTLNEVLKAAADTIRRRG